MMIAIKHYYMDTHVQPWLPGDVYRMGSYGMNIVMGCYSMVPWRPMTVLFPITQYSLIREQERIRTTCLAEQNNDNQKHLTELMGLIKLNTEGLSNEVRGHNGYGNGRMAQDTFDIKGQLMFGKQASSLSFESDDISITQGQMCSVHTTQT